MSNLIEIVLTDSGKHVYPRDATALVEVILPEPQHDFELTISSYDQNIIVDTLVGSAFLLDRDGVAVNSFNIDKDNNETFYIYGKFQNDGIAKYIVSPTPI
jgi:hypothetical protein